MKTAVTYARVSSKEQEREGFSIPAQLKLLRDYAFRNDFSVVREFVDIETAKTSGRQNFGQMVQFFSKNRECRIVLVEKTDRLYRNFRDAVTLEDLDLEIHLVKEGQIISKDAKSQAKLIHGMQLVLARNYIENLREEVKKGCGKRPNRGFILDGSLLATGIIGPIVRLRFMLRMPRSCTGSSNSTLPGSIRYRN